MADVFSSVWRKIERAKKHTNDLEAEIIAFWDTKPYEIETQGNPKTGPGSYRIKGTPKPLPESVPLIAGDAVHNLRAALDHFACGSVATDTTNTAFPVWRANRTPTGVEWKGLVKGKLSGASPRLIKAVTAVKAYKAGNGEDVWAIDNLDRIDKHRLLIAAAGIHGMITLDFADGWPPGMLNEIGITIPTGIQYALSPVGWTPIEEGTVLLAVQRADGYNAEPKFAFEVALGEPGVLKGEPVVPTLRRLIDEVESLLKRLVPLV